MTPAIRQRVYDKYSGKGEALRLYVEGYEYKEISELTGINNGTIKSRINSARKLLRKVHRNDR